MRKIKVIVVGLMLTGVVCGGVRAQSTKMSAKEKSDAARILVLRAITLVETGHYDEGVAQMDRALGFEPDKPDWLQRRGEMCFRGGRIADSLIDFDRVVKLLPKFAPRNWQRGISLYYAKRYKEGREQFESHQTVNPNDVENAVWHFLCVTRAAGLGEAKKHLIPIRGDSRVPMAQIHALFAGKGKPGDVIAAAMKSGGDEELLRRQLMYAHLYLGLYFEAIDTGDEASRHIELAATTYAVDSYMGDVAKVHWKLMLAAKAKKAKAEVGEKK